MEKSTHWYWNSRWQLHYIWLLTDIHNMHKLTYNTGTVVKNDQKLWWFGHSSLSSQIHTAISAEVSLELKASLEVNQKLITLGKGSWPAIMFIDYLKTKNQHLWRQRQSVAKLPLPQRLGNSNKSLVLTSTSLSDLCLDEMNFHYDNIQVQHTSCLPLSVCIVWLPLCY